MISPNWRKACETVIEKGRQAAREGRGEASCPYRDTRKVDGRLTFSRHWRKCWFQGYDEIRGPQKRRGPG